ncbi:uncharacterized protein LOC113356096 [Papaver somniferum]|uniref:uncharacterized protein LOC113356096 n=1 Tax=Papaver somniferum TaxID=3469 RepID=UPI000E6FF8DF|nr:uncharacterized protein LOC113356096 [Papaver somniferum]
MPVHGLPDFIFPFKLKRLKGVMKEWNFLVFGNIHSRLKQDQLRFETAARILDEDPTDIAKLNIMKDAMNTLGETRLQHATMLKQKSRNQWLVEGSSNSNFFHNSIRIRRSSNTICELVDNNGATISDYDQLHDHVVNYYEEKFNGQDLDYDMDLFDFVHDSITAEESLSMDQIPFPEEIKQAVFDLGADSAGILSKMTWLSLIILMAKVREANNLCNFRPIGLSNFFFKFFTKILATRLGSVLDKLVSEEQVAFMKGRDIHENISLASEMVNQLHLKRKISILLNGNPEGYFKINRGLRQGDPLSPLIFVLVADVLSINITKLFSENKMTPMVTRGSISPTHLFFDDDIMIFCKGSLKSLHNPVDLLGKYQRASGQTVCRQQSKIYYGGGSLTRRTYLDDYLGMSVATFPARYLGVQIMPGSVKYHHIDNVAENIKAQLAGWKGRHLSFNDRIVLVKSVIASYSIHNMVIYRWPRKFILQCERPIQNFIWSGDSNVSRDVVFAFDKICCPFEKGGLGLTRMDTMNTTIFMKLWWNIYTSHKKWAGFLRAKFFERNGCIKQYSVKSSILPGIRKVHQLVDFNTKVQLGDGRSTSLYYDAWHGNKCVADILNDHSLDRTVLVSDVLVDNQWVIHEAHLNLLLVTGLYVNQLPIIVGGNDMRIWMPEYKGEFTVSSAKNLIRKRYNMLEGASLIWRKEIHPTLAAQNWKFIRKACATYDLIRDIFKIQLAKKCSLCGTAEETLEHAARSRSRMIRDLWLLANLVIRSELWSVRNKVVFEHKQANWSVFFKSVKFVQPVECFWHPPDQNELQLCCDGAARGSPGIAGAGVVSRDASCNVIGAMSIGLRITTNFLAELYGILVGLE